MVSLPPAKQTSIGDDEPNVLTAYNTILDFERNAKTNKDALHARILGYLILHAPSTHARHEMARVTDLCGQNHDTLSELGENFLDLYIRPFKGSRGRTPASSNHSSRPSFDKDNLGLLAKVQEAPKDHKTAKMQALIRDGWKCVVTGKYDRRAEYVPDLDLETVHRVGGLRTRCVHIVPESIYFNISEHANSPEKRLYSTSVLAVLKCFGYDVEQLNGEKVHSLFNVMTMERDVQDWFDCLELWFEATEVENCYHTKVSNRLWHVPDKITLTSTTPANLPVPSPQLLALHAACAKVAHLSGAGAYIDELDQDTEDLGVLAGDGRSADVLTHALLRSMSMADGPCWGIKQGRNTSW